MTYPPDSLHAYLSAQWDEGEALLRTTQNECVHTGACWEGCPPYAQVAQRGLDAIAGMRILLAKHAQVDMGYAQPQLGCRVCSAGCCGSLCGDGGLCDVVLILAKPYEHREGFKHEWRIMMS